MERHEKAALVDIGAADYNHSSCAVREYFHRLADCGAWDRYDINPETYPHIEEIQSISVGNEGDLDVFADGTCLFSTGAGSEFWPDTEEFRIAYELDPDTLQPIEEA